MDREIVEGVRSAVAVMTAFVDQYDDDDASELASEVATQYVREQGADKLVTGFVHLSMWLMQRVKDATGDEMEATLRSAGAEASELLDGGQG